MTPAPRSVTVLGSTGSVGTQTIELLAGRPERFQVRALVAGRNATTAGRAGHCPEGGRAR